MRFQLGINRLGQARLPEPNHLRAFDSEMLLKVLRSVMLNDRVVGKIRKDFSAAVFRNVRRDNKKMKAAFTAVQNVPTHDQGAGPQHEGKQTLDRFGGRGGSGRGSSRVSALGWHHLKRL